MVYWRVRTAASEAIRAPLSRYSWTAFKFLAWSAGATLKRRELIFINMAAD